MKKYPPIPTPWSLRWREFQIRFLPVLVFLGTAAAVVVLWTRYAAAPMMIGQAEGTVATVTSTKPGMLTQLRVERFKEVLAGSPVADVIVADPRFVESSLAVIRAQVDLIRAGMDPLVGRERNRLQYEQLRLRILEHKLELATAKVQLQYAESELARVRQLFEAGGTNVVSRQMFDVAVRDRDTLKARVEQEEQLVMELENNLDGLLTVQAHNPITSGEETLRAAIKVQEDLLERTAAELGPVTLCAPISGYVATIYKRSGENIVAGEPLVTIVSAPDRIVAYVPQTSHFEPTVGMKLMVRSRAPKRMAGVGSVIEVGRLVERMPTNLVYTLRAFGTALEFGTPVLVSLPPGLDIRHGEVVDLEPLTH
ncbi:MAG: hypothetical protein N3G20_01150 [Verrucomicrobiae bacterium]|nr:hypothetical protein [Verrucomicrobiae bacterium]